TDGPRQEDIKKQPCSRWQEDLFIRYANNSVSATEIAQVHNHCYGCPACYERFLAPLEKEMSDAQEQGYAEIDRLIDNNPQLQKFIKALQNIAAETSKNHFSIEEMRNYLTIEGQPLSSSLPPSINKKPRVTRQALKIAALLLIVLTPLAFTYFLLVKP